MGRFGGDSVCRALVATTLAIGSGLIHGALHISILGSIDFLIKPHWVCKIAMYLSKRR
jgi:hypothetical protein